MSYQRRQDIDDMIMELRQEKESDTITRSQHHKEELNKNDRLKSLQLELNIQTTGRKAEQFQWGEKKKTYESKIEKLMEDLSTLLDQQQFRDQHIESLQNSMNSLYREHNEAINDLKSCRCKLKEYEDIIKIKDLNEQSTPKAAKITTNNKDCDDLFLTFYEMHDYINKEDRLMQSSNYAPNCKELVEPQSEEQEINDIDCSKELSLGARDGEYTKKKNELDPSSYENRNPVENLEFESASQADGMTYHFEQQLAKKDKHIALLKHSVESIRREHDFLSSELLKIRMREIAHRATYKYHKADVLSLQYFQHGDEKYIASGALDKTLKIWRPENSNPDNVVSRLISSIKIRALTFFTIDGVVLLACAGGSPYKIEVWNVNEKQLEYVLRGHSGYINALLQYEDQGNHYLISASADTCVNIYDLNTKTCVRTIQGHSKDVGSIAVYSHRKRMYLATGSDDNTIKLWDLKNSYQCICTLMGHSSHVRSLTFFSKNGKMYLASGSYDNTIMIWNLVDNVLEATLNGHSDKVYFMTAYNSNGRPCLLSGSNDKTIKLWDLANCSQITSLNIPSSLPVLSLSVDNDEKENSWNMVSGHGGGSIMWWSIPEKVM